MAMSVALPGVVSLRSYLPIAWAVTRWSIASARPRNEKPAAVRASFNRAPIINGLRGGTTYNDVYKSVQLYSFCKPTGSAVQCVLGLTSRLRGRNA